MYVSAVTTLKKTEYCMHSSLLAIVCFQHASCLLYIGMKQVIYSVHSCMVSLVCIWLCSPQASNNNNNNNKTDWLVVLQLEFRRNTTLYYFLKALSLKYLSIERVKPKKKLYALLCVPYS